MGLLDQLLHMEASSLWEESVRLVRPLPVCHSESELLERFAGIAIERQLDFADRIGNRQWTVDTREGVLSFGPGLSFPIQILGRFCHTTATWHWAWGDTNSDVPSFLLRQAHQLRRYGLLHGIDCLTLEAFAFHREGLDKIGAIASGLFDCCGYYLADYGPGALLVTVRGSGKQLPRGEASQTIARVFPHVLEHFDLDAERAFEGYLNAKGYSTARDGRKIVGTKGQRTITGAFDESSRLSSLRA